MTPAIHPTEDDERDLRMGSEYSTARTWLKRHAEVVTSKRKEAVPEHGSNDSDFAGRDPLID